MQTKIKKSYRFAVITSLYITIYTTLLMGVFLYYLYELQGLFLLLFAICVFLFAFVIIQLSVERFIYKRVKRFMMT